MKLAWSLQEMQVDETGMQFIGNAGR